MGVVIKYCFEKILIFAGEVRVVNVPNFVKGATKIAKIILKRFTNVRKWEDYWLNKMNCVGNVADNIGNYKCFSQNLG